MATENCKKIEPVVVKLCSKTNIPLFSGHGVHLPQLSSASFVKSADSQSLSLQNSAFYAATVYNSLTSAINYNSLSLNIYSMCGI